MVNFQTKLISAWLHQLKSSQACFLDNSDHMQLLSSLVCGLRDACRPADALTIPTLARSCKFVCVAKVPLPSERVSNSLVTNKTPHRSDPRTEHNKLFMFHQHRASNWMVLFPDSPRVVFCAALSEMKANNVFLANTRPVDLMRFFRSFPLLERINQL